MQAKRLGFITAIPQSVHRGSGCYVGIRTLAEGARALGNCVDLITPRIRTGAYLIDRFVFNQSLRWRRDWDFDATVGFDADGFALTTGGSTPHIANIKGVLGDALPFETGFSRASMALQARCEAHHARHADHVITISEYCKGRLQDLYGVRSPISVVPEMIDLARWRLLLRSHPDASPQATLLYSASAGSIRANGSHSWCGLRICCRGEFQDCVFASWEVARSIGRCVGCCATFASTILSRGWGK